MSSSQPEDKDTVSSAPANEIFSTLPTVSRVDDDDGEFTIPEGWKKPEGVPDYIHPLFADAVPDTIEDKPEYLALQTLLYDKDPADLGEQFKEEGNRMLKRGRRGWDQAIISYTKAIDAHSPIKKNVAVYYSNRAHVHILKENYGRAIDDCKESIKNDPSFIKSYFRLAKSYFLTDKLEDALEAIKKGLEINNENKDLIELKKEITSKKEERRKKKEEAAKIAIQKHRIQNLFDRCLIKKGIKIGKTVLHPLQNGCIDKLWFHHLEDSSSSSSYSSFTPVPKDNDEEELKLIENKIDEYELRFPLLVCYPEYSQTDLIQNAGENDAIVDQLASLLPAGDEDDSQGPVLDYPPWDKKRSYCLKNVRVLFYKNWVPPTNSNSSSSSTPTSSSSSSSSKKLEWVEVPLDFTFGQLFQQSEYVVPVFPVIYVLDATSPFIEKFVNN